MSSGVPVGPEDAHVIAPRETLRRRPIPKHFAGIGVAAIASVAALSGCGSSSHAATAPTSSPASAGATIVIKNFAFVPSTLTVSPGEKVTVRNTDSATHTVTSTAATKAFDTGNINPGQTVTFTAPNVTGSYAYICQIHQFMHGTLTVR